MASLSLKAHLQGNQPGNSHIYVGEDQSWEGTSEGDGRVQKVMEGMEGPKGQTDLSRHMKIQGRLAGLAQVAFRDPRRFLIDNIRPHQPTPPHQPTSLTLSRLLKRTNKLFMPLQQQGIAAPPTLLHLSLCCFEYYPPA